MESNQNSMIDGQVGKTIVEGVKINGITKSELAIQPYVEEFSNFVKKTAENYLKVCLVFKKANRDLQKDEFQFFSLKVGVSQSKASKLVKIGSRYDEFMEMVESMPVNWTTLYKLTELDKERVKELVEERVIYPEVTSLSLCKRVEEFKNAKLAKSKDKLEESKEVIINFAFDKELNDEVCGEILTLIEKFKELGAKEELSKAMKTRMKEIEECKREEMEVMEVMEEDFNEEKLAA